MLSGHQIAEERSWAYHARVAQRLFEEPELVAAARARVERWLREGTCASSYAERWLAWLDGSPEALRTFLGQRTEEAKDLRQCSPFAGVLSPQERWAIWRSVFPGQRS